ncbi:RNA ligase RtcB family protein [uncultured Erythrobacter sp.]|uniref:RNA ligase RtcB family protein n=1 Tax=uncultured Erythrobacter sp. TaxID=263913 RepID=UPI00261C7223|nr:RNA ligase RtcB family protein [uncultured Erythrobacter sp.]
MGNSYKGEHARLTSSGGQQTARTSEKSAKTRIIASSESWIEQSAIDQLHQTAQLKGIEEAVGLPDLHAGRGIPIGAAFWSTTHAYPHLVGNDIGCGMSLWQTDIRARRFKLDRAVKRLTDLDGPWSGDQPARLTESGLPAELTADALGTIGGGNHFAEFLAVDEVHCEQTFDSAGFDPAGVLLLVHSGSRGLGQAVLEGHLRQFGTGGLEVGGSDFAAYRKRHDQAMRWAELNREIIAERFLDRLSASGTRKLDIFHNTLTPHKDGWLHRKGAAPADKGLVIIPGSRGTMSYLVAPTSDEQKLDHALHSLAHGAGRKWARSDAKAKLSKRYSQSELERTELGGRVICEDKSLIFEEAPQAYKNIEGVIGDLVDAGLVKVVAVLRPLISYKMRRA